MSQRAPFMRQEVTGELLLIQWEAQHGLINTIPQLAARLRGPMGNIPVAFMPSPEDEDRYLQPSCKYCPGIAGSAHASVLQAACCPRPHAVAMRSVSEGQPTASNTRVAAPHGGLLPPAYLLWRRGGALPEPQWLQGGV